MSITISPEQVNEIADNLECGMNCYWFYTSGKIIAMPDYNDMMDGDPDAWQEDIDAIDNATEPYIMFEKMSSREAFEIMRDFADLVEDLRLKSELFRALSMKGPFSRFKYAVENSDYREEWFKFRSDANRAHVLDQLNNATFS